MDLERMRMRIAEGDLQAVEDAWMAAVEQNAAATELREVLDALSEAGHDETAETLDTSLAVCKGTYLTSRFDEQVLRAERYDAVMGRFELTDPDGRSVQLEPKLLADEYEIAHEADFRVLSRFCSDELGKLIERDPGAVLTGICAARGGQIDATALKDLLVGGHLEAAKWSGWWNRARTAVRKSDTLSIEGRSPIVVRYHPGGRSLEDRLGAAVADARRPLDYHAILQEYLRELKVRGGQADPAFVQPILRMLAHLGQSLAAREPEQALAAALVLEAAQASPLPAPPTDYVALAAALERSRDPAGEIAQLVEPSLWPLAFEALAARENAADEFEKLLRLLPASQLDEIARRLRAIGRADAVDRAAAEAVSDARGNLQICLWLWHDPAEPPAAAPSKLDLLSRLLAAMQDLGRDPDADRDVRRTAFQQIRSALAAGGCKAFLDAVGQMDRGVAATIKRRIERSPGMSPSTQDALMAVLRENFYELFIQQKVDPWLDETVLWTTEASLHRQEAVLTELVEITLPANSRAIGAAAERGDLSENSEWQYAVEEQRRLNARVAQLRDDLTRARIIRADDIPDDQVSVGSHVVLRGSDGREVELTILGPWESDVEKRIYNYKTPLAQSLLGADVGVQVTLKLTGTEDEYVIERISPGVTSLGERSE